MLKRCCLIGLLCLTGCKSTTGPLGYHGPGRVDDPMLSIEEQKARGRQRYSYVEDKSSLAPPAYVDRPSPVGR